MTKLLSAASPATAALTAPAASPAVRTPVQNVFGFLIVALSLAVLFAPPSLIPSDVYRLGLFSKYMALAVMALGIDLVWGYTGLLSLGQGVYFGLGAYSVAFSLTLQKAAADAGRPVGTVAPQFMSYTNFAPNDPNYVVPPALAWIAPLGNTWVALAVAVLVPALLAGFFALVTCRLRVKGVYFALITQALLLAVFILVRNQQRITGGVVGIKDLAKLELFGHTFHYAKKYIFELYYLMAGLLTVCFIFSAWLVRTKFGKILTAIRDNENRALALGYNTALYKSFIFALAGALSGLAGAAYVTANALCGPDYLTIAFSIEAVVWVAVGGRGSLLGAIVGTFLVGYAQSYVSSAFPDYWSILLGLLFVGVVLFLPKGLVAVAGRGALLGTLVGIIYVNTVVEFLGKHLSSKPLPKAWSVVLGCAFIALMVFVPRILGQAAKLLAYAWRFMPHYRMRTAT
jgi:urea transport system permease protein